MTSSEEEPDAPCDDRLLKKQKRARQRVDAGEPRNAPCPLAPTGPAPARNAPMSGGLYGAIFEARQHFGLFAPGCPPGCAPADMLHELLGRDNGPPRAHRVLRDLLQARKELLREPDNNNVLATNNNDEPKRAEPERAEPERCKPEPDAARDYAPELDDALLALDADSRSPPPAELPAPKGEPADRDEAGRASPHPADAKRARVEHIVSGMHSSPAPPVNGCKKRKLYLPRQQHDDRRAPGAAHSVSDDSDSETDGPPLQQKLVEKNALKSQLRSMQEQLAEMQHKYLQLCSRVGSDSADDASAASPAAAASPAPPSPASPPAARASPPPATPPAPRLATAGFGGKQPPPGRCFNGSLPLPPLPGGELSPHHFNSAAAMYLNVSQKLFLQQEQRLKEAAEQRAQAAQPSPAPPRPPRTPGGELAERLDALRPAPGAAPAAAGLDALAEVLKAEISASLAALIDSIVSRFAASRRALGEPAGAAAAAHERLGHDLLRASRLVLARSPPRAGAPPACLPPGALLLAPRAPGFPPADAPPRAPPPLFPPRAPPQPFPPPPGPFEREPPAEQHEALSLVVTPKKKRHKVTDTRITPRTVSRLLGDGPSPDKFAESPSPRPYGLALPTSVAIANPSLHESQVFSPYSPFFGGGLARSPGAPERDSPPLPHAPALLHPALLAAARRPSPDYLRAQLGPLEPDHSDCNSADLPYDSLQPTSSTLTPMHLRKAKLMFFWVRYPSSAVLKMYFPDIKFNKNNTAQLVKWFSNFREFYYIQMEKYARQAISEGLKTAEDIHVAGDSELYRVLNLHYNRNNHIEVPPNFRYVVEQTLREFFRAIQGGKDAEQSWKKSIYKVISRLDDPVPEYFKSPNFLEQLE